MKQVQDTNIYEVTDHLSAQKVWFTADHHFMHGNIIKLCKRPYQNLREMEQDLVQKWNSKIGEDDLVFYLGDFSMNTLAHKIFFPQLNFGKLVFIIGNHDRKNKLIKNLEELSISHKVEFHNRLIVKYKNESLYLTHKPVDANDSMPTICGHVHEKWKLMNSGETVNEGAPNSSKFRSKTLKAPVLNVGVDLYDFYPIHLESVINHLK